MKLKQLLSLSLAAMLVMSSVPVPVFAAAWDGTEVLAESSDDFSADEAGGETAAGATIAEDASTGGFVIDTGTDQSYEEKAAGMAEESESSTFETGTDGDMLSEVSAADITDEPASQETAASTYE